ncbi:CRISPR-associated endonuclease Cas3'' [Streptomyces sp. NA04227]|uniref:CRISPR-associated endonuclease Cas3'' n=1 Tax=Streptomyces sp. NA04227 TaxID=2742136 RepID=UPI001590FCEB|nr:CRISPR-associated endonuclease Cas3'' [Streptomyces sp. NA04227]QKW06324.1 CRISPR-associated endonuclease Cas3'' [Streptomyces sp. NA04227]
MTSAAGHGYEQSGERQVWALLGKTAKYAGGTENLLLSHLLDTAAVAERLWSDYLSPATRRALDRTAGGSGRGRHLLMWLGALHDLGKATPAWQGKYPEAARGVRAAGLGWHAPTVERYGWRHERAGGHLVRRLLAEQGWPDEHVEWVWPLIAGHHGLFPSAGALKPPPPARGQAEGRQGWPEVRRILLRRVGELLGLAPVAELVPAEVPSRALQLHLCGLVMMADQIASGAKHFKGINDPAEVSLDTARERAGKAWAELGMRRGWEELPVPDDELFERRHGQPPRPVQRLAVETARAMRAPGMVIIEAPMGEGKTRAGLLVAEVLAARFGFGGVFVGMPRWSIATPMFREVKAWAEATQEGLGTQVALLHLWHNLAPEWTALHHATAQERAAALGDCAEGPDPGPRESTGGQGPADFFFDRGRGLMCPFVVGSYDELLYAAARSYWAPMRLAGLLGKVVVLDEVHAVDVHGSQFLQEALRWLGQARVPVVLLSATLTADQRQQVADAYLAGASGREDYEGEALPDPEGCARVTAVCAPAEGESAPAAPLVRTCGSFRPDRPHTVEVLAEDVSAPHPEPAESALLARLAEELADGGCALVIRDTSLRARRLYPSVRDLFGPDEVVLLHEQLTARDRTQRTEFCLRALSPHDGAARPHRLVVVASRVAEESFDVDVDLLITDPAPIDLLLQRAGRLHRDPYRERPARLRTPRVLVTGMDVGDTPGSGTGDVPRFLPDCEQRYGRYPLLAAAHLILAAAHSTGEPWTLPRRIPELVAAAYDERLDLPAVWREAAESARRKWHEVRRERADAARLLLLSRRGSGEGGTLAGLHHVAAPAIPGGRGMSALVRGELPPAEAVVVIREGGAYRTLSGVPLGDEGETVPAAVIDDLLTHTLELPADYAPLYPAVLHPLPAWEKEPRLSFRQALVLDAECRVELAGRRLRYDAELGLVEEDGA